MEKNPDILISTARAGCVSWAAIAASIGLVIILFFLAQHDTTPPAPQPTTTPTWHPIR